VTLDSISKVSAPAFSTGRVVLLGDSAYSNEELFRRYSKVSQKGNAGPFLAPPNRLRIAMRDRMFRSTRLLAMLMKMTDSFATNIDLTDYSRYES
jgi:hypothetical protein